MSSSYLDFYNLQEDPFRLTPDPAYYYPSSEHANALLSLDFIMNNREGFCLLTGEPGTGKTTLLRIFINKWQDQAEIALIMTPRLRPEEFLQAVLDDLGVTTATFGSKNDMLKDFRNFLLRHAGNGRRVAIVVDEAQQLPDDTLEELRLLSNLETEKEKLLQIILVGQPELADKLASEQFRQLNQRIAVRSSLTHLSPQSTGDYLATRVHRAGARVATLFDPAASAAVFRNSGGVPRLINLIASRSLMVGYLQGKAMVQTDQVKIAVKEIMREERQLQGTKGGQRWWWAAGAAAALLLLVVVLMVFWRG